LAKNLSFYLKSALGFLVNIMQIVQPCEIPAAASLRAVLASKGGAFADCYCTEISGTISQSEFVEAFYTSTLFKVERKLLAWFAGKPATDRDAARLANGSATSFSAWTVESRSDDQLLLADFTGRTKSWLMVAPSGDSTSGKMTTLYFGSAVLPEQNSSSVTPKMGFAFHALLGFHKLYSKLLLRAARSRVLANRAARLP